MQIHNWSRNLKEQLLRYSKDLKKGSKYTLRAGRQHQKMGHVLYHITKGVEDQPSSRTVIVAQSALE